MGKDEGLIVTGASGKLGRLIVSELLAAGRTNIVATTRTPDALVEFAARGVKVRHVDFKSPASLEGAFNGGKRLLLISTTDVGSRVPQHSAAIEAAKAAGVEHIIYTSWPEPLKSVALVSPDHAATEELIVESGLRHTFLGNYSYSELLMFALPAALKSGKFIGAAGDGRAAYVTRKDCASAAASVLDNAAQHEGKRYAISGSKAYSRPEIAAIASDLSGKPLAYVDLPAERFQEALQTADMPEGMAKLFTSFELAIQNRELEPVSQDVLTLTGKQPVPLPTFLEAALK